MEKFICAVCGAKEARKVKRPFETTYNRQVEVKIDDVEMDECDACGEQVLTPEVSRYISRNVRKIARDRLNLLAPEEVVSIRHRYGMSQEDLERLLGLGEKVVTRWERGKVLQTKTADVVLRLMDAFPSVVQYLRTMRYQGEPDAREVVPSIVTLSEKAAQGAKARIEFMQAPLIQLIQVPSSASFGEQPEHATQYFGLQPILEGPRIKQSSITISEETQ